MPGHRSAPTSWQYPIQSKAPLPWTQPQISHYKSKSSKSFLTPSLSDTHSSPWCVRSLVAVSKKPNLFNYRCVPVRLWLEGIDTWNL